MQDSDQALMSWWMSSVPAFQRAEDALVDLGEGLVKFDTGRLARTDVDDLWAMSEIAAAGVSERVAMKPHAPGQLSTLVESLLNEYTEGIDYFTVAYAAWRAGDDSQMDAAWQLAVSSLDRATDHAASLARATRTTSQPSEASRPPEPSDDAWRYARIAGPGDRRCSIHDDWGADRCAYVEGHPGYCQNASAAAQLAEMERGLRKARRAVELSAAAQRGCLLPVLLVALVTVASLLH